MNDEAIIIPIVALTIPLVVVPVSLVLKYLRQRREWEHEERMRALEVGIAPRTGSRLASLAAIAIGAVVPVGCFGVAWLASLTHAVDSEVFIGATMVSIFAVVTGGWMGVRLARLNHESAASGHLDSMLANGKPPAFDPDAYDVVSRRG